MQILDFSFEPTVKVSVIIVSYNTRYFLEQCLISVFRAIENWHSIDPGNNQVEVMVVDNHSSDGSLEYLTAIFPVVKFISNVANTGFAKANNQALLVANGQYVLFLNPDTIVTEGFFVQCVSFLDENPAAGAIGVQMINGQGHFLKESKRGFPTPWASFSRLFGLASVFPSSVVFAKYYLGHLDKNSTHEVEALSGACMMVRRDVLDKTGGFDERFFMYAEDIDLSFRIHQQGYKNFYLANTTIIHFKGQSTTKDQHYVKLFYRAMIQFVEKHYSSRSALYARLLKTAIALRGRLESTKQQTKKTTQAEGLKFLAEGDKMSVQEVRVLQPGDVTIVGEGKEVNGTILCEGKEFPFSMLVEKMKRSPGTNYLIHAFGSKAFVGDLLSNQNRQFNAAGNHSELQPFHR